jgi:hypothetical protein
LFVATATSLEVAEKRIDDANRSSQWNEWGAKRVTSKRIKAALLEVDGPDAPAY